jgi:hypothetical protein
MQRGERSSLGDEAVAAPGKVLGRAHGAWHHRGAVLPHGERGRQIFLDRHFAPELGVERAIGDAEAALAQDGEDAIATHDLARPQGHEIGNRIAVAGIFRHCLRRSSRRLCRLRVITVCPDVRRAPDGVPPAWPFPGGAGRRLYFAPPHPIAAGADYADQQDADHYGTNALADDVVD